MIRAVTPATALEALPHLDGELLGDLDNHSAGAPQHPLHLFDLKAAEAKYGAMAATAEKLEATLKELKSTAKSCQWSIDELRRVADREREDENTDFWMFVLMAGIMRRGRGPPWEFFPGDYRADPRCPRVLVGKLMQISAPPVGLA